MSAGAGLGAALCRCLAPTHGVAQELARRGLHVAYVILEGDPLNLRFPRYKEQKGEACMLRPEAIADAYRALHVQDRTARNPGSVSDAADSPSGAPIRGGVGR